MNNHNNSKTPTTIFQSGDRSLEKGLCPDKDHSVALLVDFSLCWCFQIETALLYAKVVGTATKAYLQGLRA